MTLRWNDARPKFSISYFWTIRSLLKTLFVVCLFVIGLISTGGVTLSASDNMTIGGLTDSTLYTKENTGTESTTIDSELTAFLLEWIKNHTEYSIGSVANNPPTIKFITIGKEIDYLEEKLTIKQHMKGVYNHVNRHIWLVLPWSPDNVLHQSILLHELVHDVQFSNRSWACYQESELEAYQLQSMFLAENDEIMLINWFEIHMLSRCPSEVHP